MGCIYSSQGMTKSERLQILFKRLAMEPPSSSAGEVFDMITRVMNAVEEELCTNDDRMFPPW
jgi:hypothetical protein